MKKRVKKLLAISLSLVMVLLTVQCALFSTLAAGAVPELLTNGDFESGLDGWSVHKHSTTADATVESEGDSAYLSAANGHTLYQKVSLIAGMPYAITFRIKFAGDTFAQSGFYRAGLLAAEPSGTGAALSGASFCDATTLTSIKYWVNDSNRYYGFADKQTDKTAWQQHVITFQAEQTTDVYLAIGSYYTANNPDFYVDDVSFTATPDLITNGDFSENNLSDITIQNNGGTGAYSFIANGEDDYYLSADVGLAFYKMVALEANTSYTMSFDFRFTGEVSNSYSTFYRAGFVTSTTAGLGQTAFSDVAGTYTNNDQYYNIWSHQQSDSTSWKTHSFTFTPTEDVKVYAVVGSYNQQPLSNFDLDNWSLYKTADMVTVTTVAEEGGTVSESVKALKGTVVTLTATPDDGYLFNGWYNAEGALVSSEDNYTHLVTGAEILTARFEMDPNVAVSNYLQNGDFETVVDQFERIGEAGDSQDKMAANAGKWGRVASGVTRMEQTPVTDDNGTTENGSYFLTSGSTTDGNNYIRSFGQFVYLPTGTYTLTFIAKSNYESSEDGFWYGVYDKPIVPPGSTYIVRGQLKKTDDVWTSYSIAFTVETAQYYEVAFGASAQVADREFAIDNVVLQKAINTAMENKVAIRTAEASMADGGVGQQGMRVYNRINQTYADTVTEYGSIAIREGYLTSVKNYVGDADAAFDLDLYDTFQTKYGDAVGDYSAAGFGKGVSYSKADDFRKTYELTGTDYIFTAYLTGIKPQHYDDIYLIRSYAKNGDTVLYGETHEQSIYNIVYTIRTEYADDVAGMAAADALIAQAIEANAADDANVLTYAEWLNEIGRTDATYVS